MQEEVCILSSHQFEMIVIFSRKETSFVERLSKHQSDIYIVGEVTCLARRQLRLLHVAAFDVVLVNTLPSRSLSERFFPTRLTWTLNTTS